MILALKTADLTTHMWLYDTAEAQHPRAQTQWESGRLLSDQLLTRITDLLAAHESKLADLTGIIIFSGPGSFTSLRIGHTIANALADGLTIPVVGALGEDWLASGLSALAAAAPGHPALPHYGSEAHITKPKS